MGVHSMVEDPKINLPCSCPGKASVSDCVEKRKDTCAMSNQAQNAVLGAKMRCL